MRIGIIHEGRVPVEKRAPLSPQQCKTFFSNFPGNRLVVQPSGKRCFMNEEYEDAGIPLQYELNNCDVLVGIKEVPVKELLPDKTYIFFSHTFKKQFQNKELLKAVIENNIRLIDYELITNSRGERLIGFGRWAGIIGAYNGFRALAIRHKMKEPKPAHTCENYTALQKSARNITLPPVKIVVTGSGRVATGAIELLDHMRITRLSVDEYLALEKPDKPVYVQVDPENYVKHKAGKAFDMLDFIKNPTDYENHFLRFCSKTDMLINATYWDPQAPVLFTAGDMKDKSFTIKVIADISCDVKGALPSTLRATTIEDPFYGYNPMTESEELAFVKSTNISVMAVDNLPCELPRDASIEFGHDILERVFPYLLESDPDGIIEKATIAENGEFKPKFKYLNEWIKY